MESDRLREIKAMLRSLVQIRTEKITVQQLKRDYYSMMGENIPYKSFGYTNVDQFLRSLSDTLLVFGSGDMAQVFAIYDSKTQHIRDLVINQKSCKPRRKALQVNSPKVRQLPVASKKGVFPCVDNVRHNSRQTWFTGNADRLNIKSFHSQMININVEKKLPANNNKSNGETFNINPGKADKVIVAKKAFNKNFNEEGVKWSDAIPKWAANHVNNLITNSQNSLTNTSNENESLWNINKKTSTKSQETEKCAVKVKRNIDGKETFNLNTHEKDVIENDATSEIIVNVDLLHLDLIKTAEQFGTKIPPYNLAHDVEVGSCFQVIITEICSPDRFWFQIQKDGVDDIDVLRDQIDCYYYGLTAKDLLMPREYIAFGQVCCALCYGSWYRGEILGIPVNGEVTIFMVDYGTVRQIPVEDVKYLILPFSRLPAQALLGSLSYIKPIGMHWTIAAASCFTSLSTGVILWANIKNINKQGHNYCIELFDTTNKNMINKALVRKGYAMRNVNH